MGAGSSGGSLTIWDNRRRLQTLCHREQLVIGISLSIAWCCARGGIYGESVFFSFLVISMWVMWVFSYLPNVQESLI